ncbi:MULTISPECIES: hypothetical protein [Burkholderia]|uniref:hypothetical protein n=1 Tax=Burkholderia TaxID=32008 RepID=UPI0015818A75|nr:MULTISPECIES: hypothetical protein [Burkholderia]
MSTYDTRQYDVRLLLATPEAPCGWNHSVWQQLVPALTPLLSSARGRTSLRMTQLDRRRQGSPNQTVVRFGPIGWNEKSHRKWTHLSPDSDQDSPHWDFVCFSAWSPGPGKCNDCPPDGFLAVRNATGDGHDRSRSQFSYTILAAMACDHPEAEPALNLAFSALSAAIPSVLLAGTRRSWAGREIGEFPRSLTDCDTFGAPFKPGPKHEIPPSLDMLEGHWHIVTV